jgi:acetyltransferase-like isoleucine patch superfamily enzyme
MSHHATRRASAVRAVARAKLVFALHGVKTGELPRIYGHRPHLGGGGTIVVGDRVRVDGRQFRAALTASAGGTLRIGDHVFVNQGVTVHATLGIEIGSHVMLGDLCCIYDSNFHELEPGAGVLRARVVIEDNVWIARGALVLPGVTIGRGSVVAAGAIVNRSVPPATLVGGAPARPIRTLDLPADYIRACAHASSGLVVGPIGSDPAIGAMADQPIHPAKLA